MSLSWLPTSTWIACAAILFAGAPLWAAQTLADLKPLMAVADQIVVQNNFDTPGELDKKIYGQRQGTRWSIADGFLNGISSTPEFQASKSDHKGLEPRIAIPATPAQFIASFSLRYSGGESDNRFPFIEFGHHVCRVHFGKEKLTMVADHETTLVAETKDLHFESDRWYHVMVELKGDEVVVQFADGPTMYARHEIFSKPIANGNGVGICGVRGGKVTVDNVTIWSVVATPNSSWEATRATFPVFKAVVSEATVKEKSEKKSK